MNMDDVRRELWRAYKAEEQSEEGIVGKSSEAWCALNYPTWWDCSEDEAAFLVPVGITIYSYALGPSREHYIRYAPVDRQVNYYTWESPDIYAKAVEVIRSWIANRDEEAQP